MSLVLEALAMKLRCNPTAVLASVLLCAAALQASCKAQVDTDAGARSDAENPEVNNAENGNTSDAFGTGGHGAVVSTASGEYEIPVEVIEYHAWPPNDDIVSKLIVDARSNDVALFVRVPTDLQDEEISFPDSFTEPVLQDAFAAVQVDGQQYNIRAGEGALRFFGEDEDAIAELRVEGRFEARESGDSIELDLDLLGVVGIVCYQLEGGGNATVDGDLSTEFCQEEFDALQQLPRQ